MSEGMWADDDEQERHPLYGYLKVAKAMAQMALAEEVKELRDWKESAIKRREFWLRYWKTVRDAFWAYKWEIKIDVPQPPTR